MNALILRMIRTTETYGEFKQKCDEVAVRIGGRTFPVNDSEYRIDIQVPINISDLGRTIK